VLPLPRFVLLAAWVDLMYVCCMQLLWHAGPPRCCFCGRLGACSDGRPCSPSTCPDPPSNRTESITVGVSMLNAVLAEADNVVGRVPATERVVLALDAPNAWDPYVLSGVKFPSDLVNDSIWEWHDGNLALKQNARQSASTRSVYRFTPRDVRATVVVSDMPATFQVPGMATQITPVPNGRLHRVVEPASLAGYWIIA
jgi:hypothetical protein